MSPSSEETPGHTGQELKVSLEFLSLTLLRFVVAHRRPPDYATCTCLPHIYPGTPSDARFEVVGKFFNVQNINRARVAERTAVLLCELYGGGQQIERK